MPEPQIATLRDKEEALLPPWRKSSLWGPKPQSLPVSPIFKAARPPSSQLPIFKAPGSQSTSVFQNATALPSSIFQVPAKQPARAIKPPELGGPMQKKSVFALPHKKKEESGNRSRVDEAAAPITRGGQLSNRIVPPVEQTELVRPQEGPVPSQDLHFRSHKQLSPTSKRSARSVGEGSSCLEHISRGFPCESYSSISRAYNYIC